MFNSSKTMPRLILPLCAAGLLAVGTSCARSAPSRTSGGWQTYKNASLGFAVTRPAGWAVQADSRSILVQSRDHREAVLMEAFTAAPDESAEAHLNRLPEDQAALFP